ncbi:MAG: hypothetical protein M3541_03855 [Acidobacteriota bacterium]|nr:hypothetical protein [Acidobacteriota bacterium]MDQ3417905.1 hypothetical protein [Acidobacteriota bacterium]
MRAKIRILIAAGIGMVAAIRYFRRPRFAEDRPAMIVRGGSLIFQSGDNENSEKGRPWKQVREGRWTPDQPNGRPATHMVLTVKPQHGCDVRRRPVTDIRIRFFGTAILESFQITTANGHASVPIPLVIGSGLRDSNGSDYPTLERHGSENVFSLSYKQVDGETKDCPNITKAKIEFFD